MAESGHEDAQPIADSPPQPAINTDGGAVVQGDLDTRGGDFVGRDKVIYIGGFKVPRWLIYGLVALVLVAVVAQGVNLLGLQAVQQTLSQPTVPPPPTLAPTSTPSPTPQRMNGVFNLAVAQFGEQDANGAIVPSAVGRELSLWLANRLQQELQAEAVTASLGQVLVWQDELNRPAANPPIGMIQSEAAAIDLVRTLSATMVISGVLVGPATEPELRLAFYYASPLLRDTPDAAQGQHLLGTPVLIEFAQDPVLMREAQESNPELVQRTTLLIWLIKALTRETVRKPLQALDLFQQAEAQVATWNNASAQSVFYYFMGRTALLVQDLPTARRTLTTAVAANPANSAAQIGLGNFYYTLAQLAFTRQQPLSTAVASCAASFSNTELDVNAQAAASAEVPVDTQAAIAALDTARGHYQTAYSQAESQAPELAQIATLMLASAQRLSGEGKLAAYDQLARAGAPPVAFLTAAETDLTAAATAYAQTIAPFTAAQRFGLLAYARNGLGLTRRAQGYLAHVQAEIDQAKAAYADALDQFQACAALSAQPDRNGDRELQRKMDCFCAANRDQVEQEYIGLGGGEG